MIHFVFSEKDKRWVFLKYDTEFEYTIIKEKLFEVINQVDPVCYLKTYKGDPFKQEFLYEYTQPTGKKIFYAPIGMWYPIWKWLRDNNIEFDGLKPEIFKRKLQHTFDEFKKIVDSWNLSKRPRDYQYESAYKILEFRSSLSELATRAGKTLIAYIIFRYAMEYMGVKKILMIVPRIDLVKQGYNDFKDYAEFFKTECIWYGGKLVESSNLSIGTYQSLISFLDPTNKKYNPKFFDSYDCIFVDETHMATAKSIKTIISQPFMKSAKLIFGMTGTLPKQFTIPSYCLHSLLGPKIQTIRTKELIDNGYISPVSITQHRLIYTDKEKQLDTWIKCAEYSLSDFVEVLNKKNKKVKVHLNDPQFLIQFEKNMPKSIKDEKEKIFKNGINTAKKLKYKNYLMNCILESSKTNKLHIEIMMTHFFNERINYLIDILEDCPRNTLILAQHTNYIKYIKEELKKTFPDRPIIAVYGSSKERKIAKEVFQNNNNAIMVANYAIMGTGMTLANLCYGVLFESFKSESLNRQSIGRGLGLSEFKTKYILHDIVDMFDIKYVSQKLLDQAKERIRIYEEQKFPYEIQSVNI